MPHICDLSSNLPGLCFLSKNPLIPLARLASTGTPFFLLELSPSTRSAIRLRRDSVCDLVCDSDCVGIHKKLCRDSVCDVVHSPPLGSMDGQAVPMSTSRALDHKNPNLFITSQCPCAAQKAAASVFAECRASHFPLNPKP
jgi:hypothetical protein